MITVTSTKKERPEDISIGIFAESGSGKTTLTGTIPVKNDKDLMFIDIENGLEVHKKRSFSAIKYKAVKVDPDGPIERMKEIIKFLRANPYPWIVMDSFTHLADLIKADMENRPTKYNLLTKKGDFDGLKMYGELRKEYNKLIMAFLSLKGNKVCLFGSEEKNGKIEVMMDGSFKKRVMFQFDEFWGLKVSRDKRELVINSDGVYVAKSRMNGGAGNILDTYERPDIGYILDKCYGI